MKVINDFFKVNKENIILVFIIYLVIAAIIGGRKGIINEGWYWGIVFLGYCFVILFGFLISISLKCHKE